MPNTPAPASPRADSAVPGSVARMTAGGDPDRQEG